MHVVRTPSVQDEASRHLIRDRGQLHKEVVQHRERMRKLLVTVDAGTKSITGRSPSDSHAVN